jgi:hypothetical protein
MNELYKKIPIKLTQILNAFNIELKSYKKSIDLVFSSETAQYDKQYEKIIIEYKIKNTEFYFKVNFITEKDYINWDFYPNLETSTKKKEKGTTTTTENTYKELTENLTHWNSKLKDIYSLENPMIFFTDKFIENYAFEILEEVETVNHEYEIPLPSKKQKMALLLLEKHKEFIEIEMENSKENSEKIKDLEVAKKNITEIEGNITRMTISEVKQKWSIAFGVIMKWSAEKFVKFVKIDKATGQDISRMLGGFIGGVFGIPKIE